MSAIVLSLLSYGAIADDHAPSIGGIETYSCKFNEGNDLNDVLSVAKKWNKFASKNFSMPYQGYVLTPYYRDAETEYDFYWVGVSPSFEAQGTVAQEWLAKGTKMQAEFDSVSTCDSLATCSQTAKRAHASALGTVWTPGVCSLVFAVLMPISCST